MKHTIFISENKLKEDQQEELMRLELETFHTKTSHKGENGLACRDNRH